MLRTLGLLLCLTAVLRCQAPEDWPLYSRDLASTRYSPLRQIHTSNVTRLRLAWRFDPHLPPPDSSPEPAAAEVTPIVVSGLMFLPSGSRIFALDARTGRTIWSYNALTRIGNRAVGYWPGDVHSSPRIFFTAGKNAADHRLFALQAQTGKLDPTFGAAGSIPAGLHWGGAPCTSIKTSSSSVSTTARIATGRPATRAPSTPAPGALRWVFHTIAQPGDPNHNTWLNGAWKQRAGVNAWGWYFTADPSSATLFMTLGSPAGNYWGCDRPGADLYANSVVSVDADTGKYKWHFQVVHHDLWDIDLPAAPSLFDIPKPSGPPQHALAVIAKNALLFILDRDTGRPIYGVQEKPVPKGDVPGEWYAPTQPFPRKPPPLARDRFDQNSDLVTAADTTPEHARACRDSAFAH